MNAEAHPLSTTVFVVGGKPSTLRQLHLLARDQHLELRQLKACAQESELQLLKGLSSIVLCETTDEVELSAVHSIVKRIRQFSDLTIVAIGLPDRSSSIPSSNGEQSVSTNSLFDFELKANDDVVEVSNTLQPPRTVSEQLATEGIHKPCDRYNDLASAVGAIIQWKRRRSYVQRIIDEFMAASDEMTERQWAILRSLLAGMSNREIAASLRVSLRLVESERSIIIRKFNSSNAVELAGKVGEARAILTTSVSQEHVQVYSPLIRRLDPVHSVDTDRHASMKEFGRTTANS